MEVIKILALLAFTTVVGAFPTYEFINCKDRNTICNGYSFVINHGKTIEKFDEKKHDDSNKYKYYDYVHFIKPKDDEAVTDPYFFDNTDPRNDKGDWETNDDINTDDEVEQLKYEEMKSPEVQNEIYSGDLEYFLRDTNKKNEVESSLPEKKDIIEKE